MSKMKFGLHFDDLKSDFWRQISAGAAAKGATPTDMSDDDSDGDGSGGGLVVLPHLSLSDVLFRKIFSWGRFVVVLGIVAGLVFCEPKPVVASSLKHVKPGVDYKKKICDGKLNPDSQHFDEGYLESVKSRKYADVGDAEAAPLFANLSQSIGYRAAGLLSAKDMWRRQEDGAMAARERDLQASRE
eukprot:g11125.t1